MLTDLTVKEFLDRVASGEPVPGGGSVAALVAGLSAALSAMVARLTIGKKNDPGLDEEMAVLAQRVLRMQDQLIGDVDRDSEAYTGVLKAYRMAKGSDDEKNRRTAAIQDALKEAARVPLSVAEKGANILELVGVIVKQGNENAMTDGLVAALMARSSAIGAIYNVRINLTSIKDKDFTGEMKKRVDVLEKKTLEIEENILSFAATAMREEG
jgi:formiminotetrahydrofolate cyclodeaminase